MNQETLSTHGMISDISAMQSTARKLLGTGKEYDEVLRYIIKGNFFHDDNAKIPPIKQVIKDLRMPYHTFKKQLEKIYLELLDLENYNRYLEFQEVEYEFHLTSYNRKTVIFKTKTLPIPPRVGEQCWIPFFKEYLGTTYFYVRSIDHYLEDSKQIVTINLDSGRYNLFWHLRLDEAIEKEEISLHEQYNLSDFQLKEKLRVIPRWAR